MWFCPKPPLPRKLFSSELWDYFSTFLNFSVCLKFKPVSRVFCGVLWPPIYFVISVARASPSLSGSSCSKALCAHSGGERHLIISCRGKSLPDWCPLTDLILPLGMRPTSLTRYSPEAQGAPGCLCFLFDCFCFAALFHFTLRVGTEGEERGQKLSKQGKTWIWIGVNTATGLDRQSQNKPSRDSRWDTGPDGQHLVGGESFWVLTASLLQCLVQRGDWRLFRGGEGENRAEREIEGLVFKIEQLIGKFRFTFLLKDPVVPYE